ncbi:hypothetical protein [Phaffia rhodozyma]|uniref:Uncharacterized protein n=1 Tax=Phaffia rhodozyma TaxID=264483 RepID=A0A0F7SN80_PHARH|nr:hypothetical protein [Phaffia rhodozyma]
MTHSRPNKSAPAPPPLSPLTNVFCRSCARVITPRSKSQSSTDTPQKYCSARCRSNKPTKPIDRTIHQAWLTHLDRSATPISTELIESEVFDPIRQISSPSKSDVSEGDAQKAGEERARQREMVRQAGRRLVVFGSDAGVEGTNTQKSEFDPNTFEIVQGPPWRPVEGSFAKNEFWVRRTVL